MVVNVDTKDLFYGFFYRLNPWVAKLNHFAGVRHDNMVVLFVKIGFFIMRLILTKLMFANQTTIQ